MVLITVGFTLCIVYDRQEAGLNALLPCIKLPPDLVTIDEKRSWDLMGTVRDVFSRHIGGALTRRDIVSCAVQVMTYSFVLLIACRFTANLFSRY